MIRFFLMESIEFFLSFLSTLDPAVLITVIICASIVSVILLILLTLFPRLAEAITLIIDAIRNPHYSSRKYPSQRSKEQARRGRKGGNLK